MKDTYETIREKGLLIYEYVRGSHLYGLQKDDGTSDIDTGGVYIEPIETVLGLGLDFQDMISDERHDNTWYGLRKFLTLLLSSNPTVLEALFIPEKHILYEHPVMTEIKRHRQEFVTKGCFPAFLGYSFSQIKKAQSLNKMIVKPMVSRKTPLDFAYTFHKQGSIPLAEWLSKHGLHGEFCGLGNIPNMDQMMGLYYDWGAHRERFPEEFDLPKTKELLKKLDLKDSDFEIKGYRGLLAPNANEFRLSSVSKGEMPLCHFNFNKNAYSQHCRQYREFKEWEKNRNPERFKENLGKDFDRKNMAHCVRLLHMGLEIAKTGQVNVDRSGIDRDFIMKIRQGDSTYQEIMAYVESKRAELEDAISASTIPDAINPDIVNQILINIRRIQLTTLK